MAATATQPPATIFSEAWEAFFAALRRARGRDNAQCRGSLTLSQYQLVAPLMSDDRRTVGELAHAAGVSQPTATRMLAALCRRGFVTKAASPEDGRVVAVSLTAAGRRQWAVREEALEGQRRAVLARLSPRERDEGAVLLKRLAEVIDEL